MQDGRYSIVFDGEIYNHLELLDELAKAGYHHMGTTRRSADNRRTGAAAG